MERDGTSKSRFPPRYKQIIHKKQSDDRLNRLCKRAASENSIESDPKRQKKDEIVESLKEVKEKKGKEKVVQKETEKDKNLKEIEKKGKEKSVPPVGDVDADYGQKKGEIVESLKEVKEKKGKEKAVQKETEKDKKLKEKEKKGKEKVVPPVGDVDADYGDFDIYCSPSRLINLFKKLNDRQKDDIREIGFGGLLSLSFSRCNIDLLRWLCKNFNGVSRVFHINSKKSFVVKDEDVCDVFGLPLTNLEVVEYPRGVESELINDYNDRFGLSSRCSLATLSFVFSQLEDGGDDFKRIFVLYVLGSFLTSTGNKQVKTYVLKSLADVSLISKYNWCGFVLNSLCSSAINFKEKSTNSFSGCCYLLLILYFHRVQWRGNELPRTIPLIQHWSQADVLNRSNLESKAGFGEGEFVKGLYPISKKPRGKDQEEPVYEAPADGSEQVDQNVGKESSQEDGEGEIFIKFHLCRDDLKNSDIKKRAKDDLDELMLQMKRNLSVVTSISLSKIIEHKKKADVPPTEDQSDTQKFFEQESVQKIIDQIVSQFMKRDMPSFDILTPDDFVAKAGEKGDPIRKSTEKPIEKETGPPQSGKKGASFEKDAGPDTVDDISLTPDEHVDGWELNEAVNSVGRDILSSRKRASVSKNFWSIEAEKGYVSRFIINYKDVIQPMVQREREIVDYIFYKNESEEGVSGDVFLAREFYLISKADIISLYPNEEIYSAIISVWCLIINEHRYSQKKSRFAFSPEHSVSVSKLVDIAVKLDEINEAKARGKGRGRGKGGQKGKGKGACRGRGKSKESENEKCLEEVNSLENEVLTSWKEFLKHNERDFRSCDLVFLPLGIHSHYVCLVVNFLDRKFQYVDNIKREEDGNDYMIACDYMINLFKRFAVELNHPKHGELDGFEFEITNLPCHSMKISVGNDCGIYLMHHMMYFEGTCYTCPDLRKIAVRRAIRAQICCTLILHDINTLREAVLEDVYKFYKEKHNLFKQGIGWVPQRKNVFK